MPSNFVASLTLILSIFVHVISSPVSVLLEKGSSKGKVIYLQCKIFFRLALDSCTCMGEEE